MAPDRPAQTVPVVAAAWAQFRATEIKAGMAWVLALTAVMHVNAFGFHAYPQTFQLAFSSATLVGVCWVLWMCWRGAGKRRGAIR